MPDIDDEVDNITISLKKKIQNDSKTYLIHGYRWNDEVDISLFILE